MCLEDRLTSQSDPAFSGVSFYCFYGNIRLCLSFLLSSKLGLKPNLKRKMDCL